MLARTLKMTVVALALGAAVPAFAETLAIDGQVAIKPAGIETPQRGSTMTAVEQKFGAPANKSSAVAYDHTNGSTRIRVGVRARQSAHACLADKDEGASRGASRLAAPVSSPCLTNKLGWLRPASDRRATCLSKSRRNAPRGRNFRAFTSRRRQSSCRAFDPTTPMPHFHPVLPHQDTSPAPALCSLEPGARRSGGIGQPSYLVMHASARDRPLVPAAFFWWEVARFTLMTDGKCCITTFALHPGHLERLAALSAIPP